MNSKVEFFNLLVNNDLTNASILILANKQDLPGALTCEQLLEIKTKVITNMIVLYSHYC